jgi:hypothetical protein
MLSPDATGAAATGTAAAIGTATGFIADGIMVVLASTCTYLPCTDAVAAPHFERDSHGGGYHQIQSISTRARGRRVDCIVLTSLLTAMFTQPVVDGCPDVPNVWILARWLLFLVTLNSRKVTISWGLRCKVQQQRHASQL